MTDRKHTKRDDAQDAAADAAAQGAAADAAAQAAEAVEAAGQDDAVAPETEAAPQDGRRARQGRSPSATSTSTTCAGSRPSSRTTASACSATTRSCGCAPPRPSSSPCCRSWTTWTARSRRPRRHEEGQLLAGVELVAGQLRGTLAGHGLEEIDVEPGTLVRPHAPRGRPGAGPSTSTTRARWPRCWSAATCCTAGCCVRPRSSWPGSGGDDRLLPDARRLQERLAGRDQEGVPQARAPVSPGQEPRRQGGGGEVQGGQPGLRDALRPREAQAVRRAQPARRLRPGARRRLPPGSRRAFQGFDPRMFGQGQGGAQFDMGDLGDILGNLFGGAAGGARRGRRRPPSAAPTCRST